jgi:gliding motility-associated-like protein
VIFRFTFGSGTSCNDFDGLAIDSFSVSDLVPLPVDFAYTCLGNNAVDFTGSTGLCPDEYRWDFGDPTSASNTSVSRIDSHVFSVPGEYTVTYQVDEPCIGQRSIQRKVIIPEVLPGIVPLSCPGAANGAIGLTINFLSNPVITWNTLPPVFSDSLTGLDEGSYTVTVAGDSACAVNLTVVVPSDTLQRNTQLPDRIAFCETRELILDPGPYVNYLWSDGSTNPTLTVTEPEVYVVTVTDLDGCTLVDSVRVRERCFEGIYLPNAFTPNRDGKNELFKAYAQDINGYVLTVYNRSAQPVYVTTDPESGWDGTFEGQDCPSGVYVWSCKYDSPDKKNRTEWGKVLLIR